MLIFNSNNDEKSIFEENINISTINTTSPSINSTLINSKIDKSVKIEIKDLIEPNTYKEAISSPYKDDWIKSMSLELHTLNDNNTWDLVLRPAKAKVLKSM